MGDSGGTSLSPTLAEEIYASMARSLHGPTTKAETVAAAVGVSCNHFYKLMSKPGKFPIDGLFALAALDPDPEFLARLAGHLLAEVSARAMRRQAAGQSTIIIQELAPGRWVR